MLMQEERAYILEKKTALAPNPPAPEAEFLQLGTGARSWVRVDGKGWPTSGLALKKKILKYSPQMWLLYGLAPA